MMQVAHLIYTPPSARFLARQPGWPGERNETSCDSPLLFHLEYVLQLSVQSGMAGALQGGIKGYMSRATVVGWDAKVRHRTALSTTAVARLG